MSADKVRYPGGLNDYASKGKQWNGFCGGMNDSLFNEQVFLDSPNVFNNGVRGNGVDTKFKKSFSAQGNTPRKENGVSFFPNPFNKSNNKLFESIDKDNCGLFDLSGSKKNVWANVNRETPKLFEEEELCLEFPKNPFEGHNKYGQGVKFIDQFSDGTNFLSTNRDFSAFKSESNLAGNFCNDNNQYQQNNVKTFDHFIQPNMTNCNNKPEPFFNPLPPQNKSQQKFVTSQKPNTKQDPLDKLDQDLKKVSYQTTNATYNENYFENNFKINLNFYYSQIPSNPYNNSPQPDQFLISKEVYKSLYEVSQKSKQDYINQKLKKIFSLDKLEDLTNLDKNPFAYSLNKPQTSDIKIWLNDNNRPIDAHRMVLISGSKFYFDRLNNDKKNSFVLPNWITTRVYKPIHNYLYTKCFKENFEEYS